MEGSEDIQGQEELIAEGLLLDGDRLQAKQASNGTLDEQLTQHHRVGEDLRDTLEGWRP
jgi:hypothetical protein